MSAVLDVGYEVGAEVVSGRQRAQDDGDSNSNEANSGNTGNNPSAATAAAAKIAKAAGAAAAAAEASTEEAAAASGAHESQQAIQQARDYGGEGGVFEGLAAASHQQPSGTGLAGEQLAVASTQHPPVTRVPLPSVLPEQLELDKFMHAVSALEGFGFDMRTTKETVYAGHMTREQFKTLEVQPAGRYLKELNLICGVGHGPQIAVFW